MKTEELIQRLFIQLVQDVNPDYTFETAAYDAVKSACFIMKEYKKHETLLMMGKWDMVLDELKNE